MNPSLADTAKDFRTDMEGKVQWRSPSNIALIKYWGKVDPQLPTNPSLSFTLSNCYTETSITYRPLMEGEDPIDFYFEGERNQAFAQRIKRFLGSIDAHFPFIKHYQFVIHSSNSFPHSSGIASSASGMSALALCLCSMQESLSGRPMGKQDFFQKASIIARLGSGSASRSVYGGLVLWGQAEDIEGSSDEFAIPYPFEVDPVFDSMQDVVLLVEQGQKSVSSSVGHQLMNGHPFAEQRFEEARHNLAKIKHLLQSGDLNSWGRMVEKEALMLHAMMMTSDPYFLLMKPNTLAIMHRIMEFRAESGLHPFFTLDAGANVHLLFPEGEKTAIMDWVKSDLVGFCQKEQYLCDQVGKGPYQIE